MQASIGNTSLGIDDFSHHTILLADDNDDDLFLMLSIFRKLGICNPVRTVCDGKEAISYFKGEGQYSDRTKYPLPAIVLLDLNMPRVNGFEFLEWLRSTEPFRQITVHILSASMRQIDVQRALALGANAYLVKPSQLEALMDLMSAWYRVARHSGFAIPPLTAAAEPLVAEV